MYFWKKKIITDIITGIADSKHPLILTDQQAYTNIINQLFIDKSRH